MVPTYLIVRHTFILRRVLVLEKWLSEFILQGSKVSNGTSLPLSHLILPTCGWFRWWFTAINLLWFCASHCWLGLIKDVLLLIVSGAITDLWFGCVEFLGSLRTIIIIILHIVLTTLFLLLLLLFTMADLFERTIFISEFFHVGKLGRLSSLHCLR